MTHFKRFLEIVVDLTDPREDDSSWERWERFHDGVERYHAEGAEFDGGMSFGELRLAERF